MTARTVTTQAELDAALADGACDEIRIISEAGVWLVVGQTGDRWVRAYGSATVTAYDSATVRAYDSATVRAYDSATVTAYGSATVTAYGSATVRAYDSATVTACDSARVTAYDSATVTACDSATVTACDSATVRAGRYVAVRLRSTHAAISGGVIIDVSALDLTDAATWLDMQGITVTDGQAVVYKAVDAGLISGYGTAYPVGETVTAPDWTSAPLCGGGLHFGPTPGHAEAYYQGKSEPRFLACSIDVSEAVGLTGGTAKIKARSCRVLYEVDLAGRRIGEVTP